jgi:hypothetical protein
MRFLPSRLSGFFSHFATRLQHKRQDADFESGP